MKKDLTISKKEDYMSRLAHYTIKELNAICTRYCGKNLLYGSKSLRIHLLAQLLDGANQWHYMVYGESKWNKK